jgi:hypothetical protein
MRARGGCSHPLRTASRGLTKHTRPLSILARARRWYDGNISSRRPVTSGGGKSAHGAGVRSRTHGPAAVRTAAEAGALCNEWARGLSAMMMLSPSLVQREPEGVVHIPCAPPHEDLTKHTRPLSILARARWWYDGNISSRRRVTSGGGKSAHGAGVRSRAHGPAAVRTAAEAGALCNEWARGLSATMMLSPSLVQREPEGVVHIPCAPPHEDLTKHTRPLSILARARWWYDGNISSRRRMMSGGGKSAHGAGVRS